MFVDKHYDDIENDYHRDAYVSNLKTIHIHNYLESRGQKSFTLGDNEYSDMVGIQCIRDKKDVRLLEMSDIMKLNIHDSNMYFQLCL